MPISIFYRDYKKFLLKVAAVEFVAHDAWFRFTLDSRPLRDFRREKQRGFQATLGFEEC
jgi:hypothetical protein